MSDQEDAIALEIGADELIPETISENGDANQEDNDDANQENKEVKKEIEKVEGEHFAKSKSEEFSSENFKIELGGLPKYYPLSKLKKLLNDTLQLNAHRVKPGGMGRNVAYVNFMNEEARKKALTLLEGYKWLDSTFTVGEAKPCKDPVLLRKIDFLKVPEKKFEKLPVADRIEKAVTPYHDKEYKEQLAVKEKSVRNILRKYGNELSQLNEELNKFVHFHKIRRKGQICELDDFVESPVKEKYRNKCEFTIGMNNETEKPVVGFRVASYKEGSVEVGPVDHLKHLNDKMKSLVKFMELFLESSTHKPYDPFTHNGIWRQVACRTSNNDDLMLIVQIHPQELSDEDIEQIKEDMKDFFTVGGGVEAGVTSMFLQRYGQLESGVQIEYEHFHGKTCIEETILGKTFKAAPDAFLQVNTPACEKLYEKVAELAELDATTVLLDVCCGVGTIGLSLADFAYKVMGVEMVSKAVTNARENAEANGITNAVFYVGKAEDYMENMLSKSQRSNCTAVVDPPRAGLNSTVMNALRKCEYLDKIIYIACDLEAAVSNFINLGRPKSKTYKGNFFVPIRAIPVDLFPDTPHYELIVLFERFDDCKWDRIIAGNPRPKDQEYFNRIPALSEDAEKAIEDRREKRRIRDEGRDRSKNRRRGLGFDDRRSRGDDDRIDRGYDDRMDRGYDDRRDRGYDDRRDRGYDDRRGPSPLLNRVRPLLDDGGWQQPDWQMEEMNREKFGTGFQEGYLAAMKELMNDQRGNSRNQGEPRPLMDGDSWDDNPSEPNFDSGPGFRMNRGRGGFSNSRGRPSRGGGGLLDSNNSINPNFGKRMSGPNPGPGLIAYPPSAVGQGGSGSFPGPSNQTNSWGQNQQGRSNNASRNSFRDTGSNQAGNSWNAGSNKKGNSWNTGSNKTGNSWNTGSNQAGNSWNAGSNKTGNSWNTGSNQAGNSWNTGSNKTGNSWNAGSNQTPSWNAGSNQAGNSFNAGSKQTPSWNAETNQASSWGAGSNQTGNSWNTGSNQTGGNWGAGSNQTGGNMGAGSYQTGNMGAGSYQTGGNMGAGSNQTGGNMGAGSNQTGGIMGAGSNQTGGNMGAGSNQTGGNWGAGSNQTGGNWGTGSNQTGGNMGAVSNQTGGNWGAGSNQTGGNWGAGTNQTGSWNSGANQTANTWGAGTNQTGNTWGTGANQTGNNWGTGYQTTGSTGWNYNQYQGNEEPLAKKWKGQQGF